jgi:hypothetical protein
MLGEPSPAKQRLGIQPVVEQEFEIAMAQQHEVHE